MIHPSYRPVPVNEARVIAEKYAKSTVVILAFDPVHQVTHTATYGRTPQEKLVAAEVGKACTQLVADVNLAEVFEDFRTVAEIERCVTLLEWFIAQFQGDSGAGHNHWEQYPQYQEAIAIIKAKR